MSNGFLEQRRSGVLQTGFSRQTDFQITNNGFLTPVAALANPPPTGQLFPIPGAGLGAEAGIDTGLTILNGTPQVPYMQRWQPGVQQTIAGGFLLEIGDIVRRGTRIEANHDLNAISNSLLSGDLTRATAMVASNNYLSGTMTNPFRGLVGASAPNLNAGTTRSRATLLRPVPQFGSLTTTTSQGYSWYLSLRVPMERRFSEGFTVQGKYTFSKFVEATACLNAADARPVEVNLDFDVPHRLVLGGIYKLPFGKGRPVAQNVPRVVEGIIGGWQLPAIAPPARGRRSTSEISGLSAISMG